MGWWDGAGEGVGGEILCIQVMDLVSLDWPGKYLCALDGVREGSVYCTVWWSDFERIKKL